MNRSEGAKKVGPPQKNSLDPLLHNNEYIKYKMGKKLKITCRSFSVSANFTTKLDEAP